MRGATHRAGSDACARRLAELGALRPRPRHRRRDIAVMSSIDMYAQLRAGHGWSYDRCEQWMCDSLTTLLLK